MAGCRFPTLSDRFPLMLPTAFGRKRTLTTLRSPTKTDVFGSNQETASMQKVIANQATISSTPVNGQLFPQYLANFSETQQMPSPAQ